MKKTYVHSSQNSPNKHLSTSPPDASITAKKPQVEHRFADFSITPKEPLRIQAKFVVGGVDNLHEREAERTADLVMHQISDPNQQPDKLISKAQPAIRRASSGGADHLGGALPKNTEDKIRGTSGGQALPPQVRAPMERAFSADFRHVRVHADASSTQLNRSLHARAFTSGSNLFFRREDYNPNSKAGLRLIAHELTHVVQQQGAGQTSGDLIQRYYLWDQTGLHYDPSDVVPDGYSYLGMHQQAPHQEDKLYIKGLPKRAPRERRNRPGGGGLPLAPLAGAAPARSPKIKEEVDQKKKGQALLKPKAAASTATAAAGTASAAAAPGAQEEDAFDVLWNEQLKHSGADYKQLRNAFDQGGQAAVYSIAYGKKQANQKSIGAAPAKKKDAANPAQQAFDFFKASNIKNKTMNCDVALEMPAEQIANIKALIKACDVKFKGAQQDGNKLLQVTEAVRELLMYVHGLFVTKDDAYPVLQQAGLTELLILISTSGACNNETSQKLLNALQKIHPPKK